MPNEPLGRARFYSLDYISGVGSTRFEGISFPAHVIEHNYETHQDEIVPVFTSLHGPYVDENKLFNGSEILVSLLNLYLKINTPDYSLNISEAVRGWCDDYFYPYHMDELSIVARENTIIDPDVVDHLKRVCTFEVDRFLEDLGNLGTTYELYDALQRVRYSGDVEAGRNMYAESRVWENLPFLERYKSENDKDFVKGVFSDYDELMDKVVERFPDLSLRLRMNENSGKLELGADVKSVFDIAWHAFARVASDVEVPDDFEVTDDYVPRQYYSTAVRSCLACGNYFVREHNRQKYCLKPECQRIRNNRKSRAAYQRKKAKQNLT